MEATNDDKENNGIEMCTENFSQDRKRAREETVKSEVEPDASVAAQAVPNSPLVASTCQHLPALEVVNCAFIEPTGAAPFDTPMKFRFTLAMHEYHISGRDALHPLPDPFDVIFKWANITGNGKGDMVLDELEVGPLSLGEVGQNRNDSTTVFDLECDPLDLESEEGLTVAEDDILGNGCLEISMQYKGQEFARCMWPLLVGWANPAHETEMPERIEASLLTREIVTRRRLGSTKGSCTILNKMINWN